MSLEERTASTYYIALGDSVSLDRYPAMDAVATRPRALREAEAAGVATPALGAAALFFRNHEAAWPEFVGRDLVSAYPGITFTNLATPGATIRQVRDNQLPKLSLVGSEAIVTLTIGLNDLVQACAYSTSTAELEEHVQAISEAYSALVASTISQLPTDTTLILTTVYDPSDGAGRVPDALDDMGKIPLFRLDDLNTHIRNVARTTACARLADVHAHFTGHGLRADARERWYWKQCMLEPSAQGASEIRRMWLAALDLGYGQGDSSYGGVAARGEELSQRRSA